jgi:hypothetical protein
MVIELEIMRRALLAVLVTLALHACGDDARRPIGDACTATAQCETGLCGGGICLDPDGDNDGDGLSNRLEVGLGTNPLAADTDVDGVDDPTEVGDVEARADEDGDSAIDAVESLIEDCDEDGRVDQRDADDGVDPSGVCALRCDARDEALPLVENTTSDGTLTPGERAFFEVEIPAGAECVVRASANAAEADPDLRIFLDARGLCDHAREEAARGLTAADEAAPPAHVGTLPAGTLETATLVTTASRLYLRVDGAAPVSTRYGISVQCAR